MSDMEIHESTVKHRYVPLKDLYQFVKPDGLGRLILLLHLFQQEWPGRRVKLRASGIWTEDTIFSS